MIIYFGNRIQYT